MRGGSVLVWNVPDIEFTPLVARNDADNAFRRTAWIIGPNLENYEMSYKIGYSYFFRRNVNVIDDVHFICKLIRRSTH